MQIIIFLKKLKENSYALKLQKNMVYADFGFIFQVIFLVLRS